MPNLFDNIKAAASRGIRLSSTFGGGGAAASAVGGYNYAGNGYNYGGGINGLSRWTPGSKINWDAITGNIWENPVAYTCLRIITDNMSQSPVVIETKNAKGVYERNLKHPLTALIMQPNKFYSWGTLQAGFLLSMHNNSDAYIGIERDANGNPAELYWLPSGVSPCREPGSKALFDGWWYQQPGKKAPVKVAREDIIHIPLGSNPNSPGFGLSGWASLKPDAYQLQQGGNYGANILRNNGALGVLISPDMTLDEARELDINPQEITDKWQAKTTGDEVGKAFVLNFPFKATFPKNSPQDLAIDTMLDRPESNICAVLRVPILMVGAYAGRNSGTFNNVEQARQSLYEDTLIPMQCIIGGEFSSQLLRQTGGMENDRLAYDNSSVRCLQPDKDALHKRAREDWESNLTTRADFKRVTKQDVLPEDEHVYRWQLPSVADSAQTDGGQIKEGLENAGHDVGILQDKQKAAETQRNAPPLAPAIPAITPKPNPPAPASKSYEIKDDRGGEHWVTTDSGQHLLIGGAGDVENHGATTEKASPAKTKSEIAKQSAKLTDARVQRYTEEHNEPILAKAVGGNTLKDNEPVDVEIRSGGKIAHGIEMKTMVNNSQGRIHMHTDAMQRKQAYVHENKAAFHTVVFDDQKVFHAKGENQHDESQRVMYYKRGFGSFRTTGMHEVKDVAELNKLIQTPDAQLPKKAQPPKAYQSAIL